MESITTSRINRFGRRGRLMLTATVAAAALVSAAPAAGADLPVKTPGPANDEIAGATGLGSAHQLDLAGQSNQAASAEAFPVFDCVESHHTVWYQWTAPQQGVVQFRALGQAAGDDLTIAAFDGAPGSSRGNVACNNDSGSGPNPNITFGVEKGHTYYVVVGSDNEFTAGPFDLRMRFVNVSISPAVVDEGAAGETSTLPLTVSLSSAELNPLEVTVVDRGSGTAQPGVDYQAFPAQTVDFGVGVTSRTGAVTVLGNDVDQPNRRIIVAATDASVLVSQANPTPATFDPGATRRLTIRDDDE